MRVCRSFGSFAFISTGNVLEVERLYDPARCAFLEE